MDTYLLGRLSVADLAAASQLEAMIAESLHAEEFFRQRIPSPAGLYARTRSRLRRRAGLEHGYRIDVLLRSYDDELERRVQQQLAEAAAAVPAKAAAMQSVQRVNQLEWCFDLTHPYSSDKIRDFWDHMVFIEESTLRGYTWRPSGPLRTPDENEKGIYAQPCRVEGHIDQVLKEREHVLHLAHNNYWKGIEVQQQEFSFPELDVRALTQNAANK